MKDKAIIYIAIVAAILFLMNFGRKYLVTVTKSNLSNYLYKGDFDNFEKLINKWYIKYLIYPFNIDFLKLNEAIVKQDRKKVDACFNEFDNKTITDKQKESVYQKAFFYYLQENDEKKLNKYYKLIKELEDKTLFNSIDEIYKVVVLKETEQLDKFLKLYNENNENTMAVFLIYNIYMNKNEKDEASKYLNIFNDLVEKGAYIK